MVEKCEREYNNMLIVDIVGFFEYSSGERDKETSWKW